MTRDAILGWYYSFETGTLVELALLIGFVVTIAFVVWAVKVIHRRLPKDRRHMPRIVDYG